MRKIKLLIALSLVFSTFTYSTDISPDVQKEITVAYAKFESTTRPLITNLYSLRDQLEVLQSNKEADPKIIGEIQREISGIRKDLNTMESNFKYSLSDKYGKQVYREDIRDLLKEIGLKESDSGWREENKGERPEKPVQLPVWNELPGTAKPGLKPEVPVQQPVWSEVPGTAKPGVKPAKPTQLPVWSEMPNKDDDKEERKEREKKEREEKEEREKKEREDREERNKKDKN